MRLDVSLQQRLEQKLILAPQIIQSIEILQLPIPELLELVQEEMEENPFIEFNDERAELSTNDVERTAAEGDRLSDELDRINGEAGWSGFEERRGARASSALKDRKFEAMQNTAARPKSLQEHLIEQFSMIDMDDPVREIGENIIYNIDSNGYLPYTLDEIVKSIDKVPEGPLGEKEEAEYTMEQAEEALFHVQSLEPPGVGGLDLKEVLLLQVPVGRKHAFERALISKYMNEIEKNKLPRIAQKTGRRMKRIKKAVEYIRNLNPRPGAVFSSESAHYIVPDVVVQRVEGEYEVTLENTYLPKVKITQQYREMLRENKNNANLVEFIRRKVDGAKWLQRAIEQRQSTIYRIASEIVAFQEAFLDHGISHLKPLKMQTIADKVGVHVSTVGRAINGKYIQTPKGIYALKFFFTSGTVTSEGDSESTRSVKNRLKAILKAEDSKKPLSDIEIVKMLKEQGLSIARRTVTKYRKALGFRSSRKRKEY